MGGVLLTGLAGFWFSFQGLQNEKELLKRHQASVARLQSLVLWEPSPTPQNLELMVQDLRDLEQRLFRYQEAFSSDRTLTTSPDAIEVLPKIQGLIVEYRRAFQARGIRLDEKEAFGFARYQQEVEPPPAPVIPLVDKQIQVMSYLLDLLLESEPSAILSIERELVEAGDPNLKTGTTKAAPREDSFHIDAQASARVPGLIHTQAFRLRFSGYTESLRKFLNELSAFNLPVVVRGVEVSQASKTRENSERPRTRDKDSSFARLFGSAEEEPVTAPESTPAGQKPIIENNESHFEVVLEFIELKHDDSGQGETATPLTQR